MSLDPADATEEPGDLNNHALQEFVAPDSFLADQSSILAPWDTNHFDQQNRRSSSTSTGSGSSASSGSSSGSSSSGNSGSSSSDSSSGSSSGSGSDSGTSGESDSDDSTSGGSTHTNTIDSTRLPSPGPAPPIIPVSDGNNIREDFSTDDEYDLNDDLNDMVVSINDAFNDAFHHEDPNQLNNGHWNTSSTSSTGMGPREEEIKDQDEDETEDETEDEDEEDGDGDEDFLLLDRRQQRSYVDEEGNFRLAAASSMDNYDEDNLSEDDMNRAFFLERDYQEFTIDGDEIEMIRLQAEANAAISDDPGDDELADISQATHDIVNTTSLVEPVQVSSGQTLQNGEATLDAGQATLPGDMEGPMSVDEENIPPNN